LQHFIACLTLCLGGVTAVNPNAADAIWGVERFLILLCASFWTIGTAFRAANAVSRQRDNRTLDSLPTQPVSCNAILEAKWWGAVLQGRGFAYALAAVIIVCLLSGSFHPLGAILFMLAIAAHVGFLASLGIYISLVSRTTLRAQVAMALVLCGFFLAGLIWQRFEYSKRFRAMPRVTVTRNGTEFTPSWVLLIAEAGVNPPGAWWHTTFSWKDFAKATDTSDWRFMPRLVVAACGAAAFALLACPIWLAACRRFRATPCDRRFSA
jgi:hypothetical protein